MPLKLPLKKMSVREKVAAMESIWEDLARTPRAVESPSWHQEILSERRGRLTERNGRFTDWETAKKRIRRKTS